MGRFSKLLETSKPPAQEAQTAKESATGKGAFKPATQPAAQPAIQLVRQPVTQPAGQRVKQPTKQKTLEPGTTIEKSFYITPLLHERLNEAVQYFQQKHGIKKVDRSIVLCVLLEDQTLWTSQALDTLLSKIIGILTKRLIK